MTVLLDQPLHTVPFVLFDLESTGLDVQAGHRICEIAALRIQDHAVQARFEQLVNPERDIDPDAYAVNGISQAMVNTAPPFRTVWQQFAPLLKDAVLVAHNAYFDMGFLSMQLAELNQPPLPNYVVDTLALARRYITARRYNLTALALSLGERAPNHRAMSDVNALKPVFEHLVDVLYRKGVYTLDDLLRAQRGLLPGDQEGVISQKISHAVHHGEQLMISYRTNGGDPVERRVQPLGITIEGKRHILHAYCYLRNAPRAFSLDRLSLLNHDEQANFFYSDNESLA